VNRGKWKKENEQGSETYNVSKFSCSLSLNLVHSKIVNRRKWTRFKYLEFDLNYINPL